MKKMIVGAIIVVLVIVFGIFAFKSFSGKSGGQEVEEIPTPTVVLPTISEDVKVDLTARNLNREVVLTISSIPDNVVSIEYELTYITDKGLPRGVLGKIKIQQESEITRDDIVLGTCSSGRCVYDTGVTSIDLSLKFNFNDDTSSVFQKTYDL